jgi:transposase-like protein
LGAPSGIKKSEVSRICGGLDEIVEAFRTRRLDHVEFPYVYLDATYLHVRNDTSQVASMAVVIATGITAVGEREVLGVDVGDSEDEVFWRSFLRSLKGRGLGGVRLVISDQHAGLVAALRRVFQGASHQRRRVHFARNLLALVPKSHQDMVAAVFRTIFAPTRPRHRRCHLGSGPRPARRPIPPHRSTDGRRQSRSPRLHRLPPRPLVENLVDQPAIG